MGKQLPFHTGGNKRDPAKPQTKSVTMDIAYKLETKLLGISDNWKQMQSD
jgi:hypothetical protein